MSSQSGLVNIGLIIMVFSHYNASRREHYFGLRVIGLCRLLLCSWISWHSAVCVSPAGLRTDCPRYAHCKAMVLVLDSRDSGSSQGFLTQTSLTEITVSVFSLQVHAGWIPDLCRRGRAKKQAHTENEDLETSGVASTLAPENLAT